MWFFESLSTFCASSLNYPCSSPMTFVSMLTCDYSSFKAASWSKERTSSSFLPF